MAGKSGPEADKAQLTTLVAGLKELPPKIRTATRRDLRTVGDGVIGRQRELLSGPLPTGTAKAGQTRTLAVSKRKGTFYIVKKNIYADTDVKNSGRSSGMREAIKAGLRTRVSTGKRYQGIDIKTTGPKAGKYNQAKVWNRAQFRHPTFGRPDSFVYQKGQPYFYGPIRDGFDDMVNRAEEILTRNVKEI